MGVTRLHKTVLNSESLVHFLMVLEMQARLQGPREPRVEILCSVVAGYLRGPFYFCEECSIAQLRYALELADIFILARGKMSVESVCSLPAQSPTLDRL